MFIFRCILYNNTRVIFFVVASLKCYQCSSGESWDKCEDELKEITCPEEHDEVCSKVSYHHEAHMRKTFTKFCEKEDQCTIETNPICRAAQSQNATCESYCCTGDLCNTGSATRISGVLLTACAVVSMAVL